MILAFRTGVRSCQLFKLTAKLHMLFHNKRCFWLRVRPCTSPVCMACYAVSFKFNMHSAPHLPLSITRLPCPLVHTPMKCSPQLSAHPPTVVHCPVSTQYRPACILPAVPASPLVICLAWKPLAAVTQQGQINHALIQQALEVVPSLFVTNTACSSG